VVAVGGYVFVMGHWFVGLQEDADGQPVTVFQGLHASIVGVDLYRVDQATSMMAGDLTPAARSRVTAGIPADNRDDAQRILDNLRGLQLPLCRTIPTTTAPSTTTDDATAAPVPPVDPALPTPSEAFPPLPAAPTTDTAPTTEAPTTSSPPTRTGEEGVDCRDAD
jgi:protein phosphatase